MYPQLHWAVPGCSRQSTGGGSLLDAFALQAALELRNPAVRLTDAGPAAPASAAAAEELAQTRASAGARSQRARLAERALAERVLHGVRGEGLDLADVDVLDARGGQHLLRQLLLTAGV